MSEILDIGIIKYRNEKNGHYFFSPNTMRFFKSRVCSETYYNKGSKYCYFITSEKFDETTPRLYSIRKAEIETGLITTEDEIEESILDFQKFKSKKTAKSALDRHLEKEKELMVVKE